MIISKEDILDSVARMSVIEIVDIQSATCETETPCDN